MKHIITAYTTLIVIIVNVLLCITVSNAAASMVEAKEYKAHVVAEIENSNFNKNVIAACIDQANAAGYELQITNCIYDENYNIQTTEVILAYPYKLPLFGVFETKTTRGIAR